MNKSSQLLTYYIVMLMKEQGLQVDIDTYNELGEILDSVEEKNSRLEKQIIALEEQIEMIADKIGMSLY